MNPNEELKRFISFCGSYCKKCPWFTGELRNIFQEAAFAFEEYGLERRLEGKVDINEFKKGFEILKELGICSGCKQEIKETPEEDRCKIRQCACKRGYNTCAECPEFPCEMLKSHPGVVKFKCIENLQEIKEKGLKGWLEKQWRFK
ncbi:MAG: hypothetical protein DRG69_07450 [Deltaproteobacteria bacterium]|nr:MAG: hypothetical protein DRG69_07450 [Deltaproteobacteria bacterium]